VDESGTLENLGFTRGGIVETILVTLNRDGSMNAAPMGVRLAGDLFELKPFKTSTTYGNLRRGGHATVNTTQDPRLFLATAFKEEVEDQPSVDEGMALSGSDSTIHVEVQGEKRTQGDQGLFAAKPVKVSVRRQHPTVFSRGRAGAIEAVIHATRVKAFMGSGKDAEVEELVKWIDGCAATVRRVSPVGSPECTVVDALYEMMKSWGVQT
jgi:hypothetical protein